MLNAGNFKLEGYCMHLGKAVKRELPVRRNRFVFVSYMRALISATEKQLESIEPNNEIAFSVFFRYYLPAIDYAISGCYLR